MKRNRILCTVLAITGVGPAMAAPAPAIPDFTKGDPIPADARHDWNLGPTGLRGWMYSDQLATSDARQVAITRVDPGSPADGILAVGDVLLGVGGKPFLFDPRVELGRAVTAAETEAGGGTLRLTRWRNTEVREVALQLPVLGTFSNTAPFDCEKSRRILEKAIRKLASRIAQPDYARSTESIPRALNALALLGNGAPSHLPRVSAEAAWAADFAPEGFKTWHYGYVMIFLAEYIKATGDPAPRDGLRRLALEAARGQSAVGF